MHAQQSTRVRLEEELATTAKVDDELERTSREKDDIREHFRSLQRELPVELRCSPTGLQESGQAANARVPSERRLTLQPVR